MSALVDRSDRRSVLAAMLLPAIVLAVAYAWWYRGSEQRRIGALQQDITDARAAIPAPATEASLSRELADLQRRRDELRARRDELRRGGGLPRLAERPDAQVRALRTAEILQRHKIALDEELTEELVPGGPLAAAASWAAAHGLAGVRVRRLTLRGNYVAVVDALSEITSAEVGAVPLLLPLARDPHGRGGLVWTLVLV
jgi:hypothetical protein